MHKIPRAMGMTALDQKAKSKKVIFLDLDNTLYAYKPCHRYALNQAYSAYRKHVEKISWRTFLAFYEKARFRTHRRLRGQAASHSRLLYFQNMLETRLGRTDFKKSLLLEKIYWQAFFSRMKLAPWVRPFLKRMKAEGKRIVVVTDLTTELQMKKLLRFRLEKSIDAIVTSEEAGAEKPDPKIFKLAFQKARCLARQALLIGDDSQKDIYPLLEFIKVLSVV
ncbi:MAG: HAD-IA family hydrolase [Candidatus Omnitrophica bacterium]|nr:HAD-IA family hydrolase [Candidatus Omnitrophota bacterium]